MKIIFFMESYRCGGVDTFVINLINNWPITSDGLTLICNDNHAGLGLIQREIYRPCTIIAHNVKTFMVFFDRSQKKTSLNYFLEFPLRLFSPVLRYIFLLYNILAQRGILLRNSPDRLMVINGGYPGGDSCRAATITWGIFSKKPHSIHNFHGIALKPGWHIKLQDYIVDMLVSRFSRAFITVSRAAAETMTCRKAIYKRKPVFSIYSGINISRNKQTYIFRNIKEEIGIPSSSRLCLMLGGYTYNKNFNKGHNFLFRAFKKVLKQVPSAHLLICGHGSEEEIERVRHLAEKLNLKNNVNLLGFQNDVSGLFKNTDILLISAQAFESFGLVCIEAMAHRVPVVATNVGGLPELVINGQGGYCVDKDDIDAFSGFTIKLLKDENLRVEQGQRGFQRYEAYFTASRMAEEYARLIRN